MLSGYYVNKRGEGMEEDKKIYELCQALSDYIFHNKKYDPYTKVIITDSNIEIVQAVQGIPIKRY